MSFSQHTAGSLTYIPHPELPAAPVFSQPVGPFPCPSVAVVCVSFCLRIGNLQTNIDQQISEKKSARRNKAHRGEAEEEEEDEEEEVWPLSETVLVPLSWVWHFALCQWPKSKSVKSISEMRFSNQLFLLKKMKLIILMSFSRGICSCCEPNACIAN